MKAKAQRTLKSTLLTTSMMLIGLGTSMVPLAATVYPGLACIAGGTVLIVVREAVKDVKIDTSDDMQ